MKNLVKYENRCILRKLVPFYAILLAFSVVGALMFANPNREIYVITDNIMMQAMYTIGMIAYWTVLVSIGAMTLIVILQRYAQGVLGDEGYMLHMLPVSTSKLVWSKLIGATIVQVLSVIAVFLSMIIILSSEIFPGMQEFLRAVFEEFAYYITNFGQLSVWSLALFLVELAIICFLSMLQGVAQIYLAMSIGHLANKHRFLLSFAAYFGINMAISTLTSVANSIYYDITDMQVLDEFMASAEVTANMHGVILLGILVTAALTVVYMQLSVYLVSKKLNLE